MVFCQKFEIFSFFVLERNIPKKVFCDLLDRKLAILDKKNIDIKQQKIGIFPKWVVHVFFFFNKNWNYLLFLAMQLKTKCFETFQIENQPCQTRKHRFKKVENLTFFQGVQQTVFGRKWGSLFLFCIRAKYFETKCLVTFWLKNQPFQSRKISIQKSKKLAFFQRGKSVVFGQNWKVCSFFVFQQSNPKQTVL